MIKHKANPKIKAKKVKRNPSAKNNYNDIKYFIKFNSENFDEIGEGSEGKAFYFKLNSRLVVNAEVLNKGEYVLKITHRKNYSSSELERLDLLSKYGLIPKIYIFNSKYIIMKYIKGKSLNDLLFDKELSKSEQSIIENKVEKLYDIWEKLGFDKYLDTNDENILVTSDLKKVYIIDPMIDDKWVENFWRFSF
jgi:predicted Ser/Thr protein kinase